MKNAQYCQWEIGLCTTLGFSLHIFVTVLEMLLMTDVQYVFIQSIHLFIYLVSNGCDGTVVMTPLKISRP